MKTYLVTGAAGFIGAAVADRLVKEGNKVVTIDNLSTGFREAIPEGVIFIEGDTFNPQIIAKLDNYKFDAIFHIAGQSGGVTCWKDPIYDLNSNVTSTLLLLNYCKEHGCKTFVYASSMSVYGDENPCPVREDDEIKPKSFYAVGKNASEHYMRIYSAEFGLKCTALRLNNTYGPGQNMDNLLQGMVSIFMEQAIRNHHIHVMGDAKRYRDFVYIDDTVEAFILAANGKEKELYNYYTTATNRKTTCERLVAEIMKNLPFDVTVEYKGRTQGDQFGIFCSYEKIFNALGWEPKTTLEEGIKTMAAWALQRKK
ncbi:MAG: NAD-dependent epimerase/dehydratase family protein [Bacteroidales bacterium]|nr:NAD-dependent epimerase/dehydratase family protein [Bacteroidales bacterium]